jgi:NAD-dependent deacetylase
MINLTADDRLFVLTGAGVSAESGLPTFRGAGGLRRGYRVEDVASPVAWARDPLMVWQFYSMRRKVHTEKQPNPGHIALARLEESLADRFFLCTQNVDKLHEEAGSRRVVHMHGRLFQSRCESCARPPFDDANTYQEQVPRCPCGGQIRPHICWFGETPFDMDLIERELRRCSVFMAVGTSGVVYPAAAFAAQTRQGQRARTYYVGPEEPANRAMFDECFTGPAGELLPGLFQWSHLNRVSV